MDYFGSFLAALELWKYVKGYDPRTGASNSNVQPEARPPIQGNFKTQASISN